MEGLPGEFVGNQLIGVVDFEDFSHGATSTVKTGAECAGTGTDVRNRCNPHACRERRERRLGYHAVRKGVFYLIAAAARLGWQGPMLRQRNMGGILGCDAFAFRHTCSMHKSRAQIVEETIHSSGKRFVVALTGGGSRALASLLTVPGASRSLLEATVPYSDAALEGFLQSPVARASSGLTARMLATRCWQRACYLSGSGPQTETNVSDLRGLGATASLASDRVKQGDHRIHIAWQSDQATALYSLTFEKGRRERSGEEQLAADLILLAICDACGADRRDAYQLVTSQLKSDEDVIEKKTSAPLSWRSLWLAERDLVVWPLRAAQNSTAAAANDSSLPRTIFPGAFNPPHAGHWQMIAAAAARLGERVAIELSIENVDKPLLDFLSLDARLIELAAGCAPGCDTRVLLTRAPTFTEKSRLFPGATFVVGADTLERIADPKYYSDNIARRDEAIQSILVSGNRFLVFGRQHERRFRTLAELALPSALVAICDSVPEDEFRSDLSSTALRRQTPGYD